MAAWYGIGIDIGGATIKAVVINSAGEVIQRGREIAGQDSLSAVQRLIDTLSTRHAPHIKGIGIAVAGVVDRAKGVVLRAPSLQGLVGMDLVSELGKRSSIPVVVENDANAAAYAERQAGAGRTLRNFVVISLGTRIGSGIVINGTLLPISAEIGHMSINATGDACSCGNVGCLESYASATAIVNHAIQKLEGGSESILRGLHNGNFYKITAEDIYSSALEGDSLSRTVLREAGEDLGIGIANIINILSPERIILSGGLLGAWNIYIDAAIKEASKRALKELYRPEMIIPSSLGDDAAALGAAALALKKVSQELCPDDTKNLAGAA